MKKTIAILMFLMCAFSMNAQDLIVTNDGANIKAYNVEISDKYVFYTLDKESEDIKRIAKVDILAIRKENGEKVHFDSSDSNAPLQQSVSNIPSPDLKYCDTTLPIVENRKGLLLSKGNAVYIPDSDLDYEHAGVMALRKLILQQGYWKVAATPSQAHFVLLYRIDLRYNDHLYQLPIQRVDEFTKKELGSKDITSMAVHFGSMHCNEEINENIKLATKLFYMLEKIQKSIDKQNAPKWIERLFTIE